MTTPPTPVFRFPIGDVARRTGLSVSAVWFYSDEGIVPATEVTAAGHRPYGPEAVAQLDLIRTMRELGTGLEQIRQVLTGETTLPYLLAEHLDVIERQARSLQARRAVLRALVRQEDPARRAGLLGKLVTMPDIERERLIDDFWQEAPWSARSTTAWRLTRSSTRRPPPVLRVRGRLTCPRPGRGCPRPSSPRGRPALRPRLPFRT